MIKCAIKCMQKANVLQDFSLLCLRFTLAYGFYEPAMRKLNNFGGIVSWFKSMNLIFPTFQAFMATGIELLVVLLLPLGFMTRLISFPSIFVMFMAIHLVHFQNGFKASNNGFEIPFYYLLMFFVLVSFGSGKYSLDYMIKRRS